MEHDPSQSQSWERELLDTPTLNVLTFGRPRLDALLWSMTLEDLLLQSNKIDFKLNQGIHCFSKKSYLSYASCLDRETVAPLHFVRAHCTRTRRALLLSRHCGVGPAAVFA